MEVVYDRVDLLACRREGITRPEQVIARGTNEVWLVPDGPVRLGQPVSWSRTRQGDHVRIPLIPYLLHREGDLTLAFMAAYAFNCAFELNHQVSRLHLVTGVPLETLPDDPTSEFGYKLHLGIGILLR